MSKRNCCFAKTEFVCCRFLRENLDVCKYYEPSNLSDHENHKCKHELKISGRASNTCRSEDARSAAFAEQDVVKLLHEEGALPLSACRETKTSTLTRQRRGEEMSKNNECFIDTEDRFQPTNSGEGTR